MIKITKKGLVNRQWNSDKEENENIIIECPTALQLHSDSCEIEEGVTLGNIFFIIKRNIDWWDQILESWVKEFVDEGLKILTAKEEKDDDPVELLELYWQAEEWDGELEFPTFMSFHGKGSPDKKDGINYGVGFTPTNELARLPIKVNTDFVIYETLHKKPYYKEKYKSTVTPTLFQIIFGIFWELSFHGGPDGRDEVIEMLDQRVKDIKSGKAKFIPMEDVFKDFGIKEEEEDE